MICCRWLRRRVNKGEQHKKAICCLSSALPKLAINTTWWIHTHRELESSEAMSLWMLCLNSALTDVHIHRSRLVAAKKHQLYLKTGWCSHTSAPVEFAASSLCPPSPALLAPSQNTTGQPSKQDWCIMTNHPANCSQQQLSCHTEHSPPPPFDNPTLSLSLSRRLSLWWPAAIRHQNEATAAASWLRHTYATCW